MNFWERLTAPIAFGQKTAPEQKGVTVEGYVPSPVISGYSAPRLAGEITVTHAVTHGLAVSSWLQTAMTKKARAFASVPLVLEKRRRKGWVREEGHELAALLARPNPHMSMQDVMERWAMHLEITGNALAHRVKATDGRTLELWPVDPAHIKPVAGKTSETWITGYLFTPRPDVRLTLLPDEITHWMYQSPADPRWGLSPLRAAALAVDTDVEAQRWNRAVISGGGKPVGAVLLPDTLSDEQWQMANAQVNENASARARGFLVFGGATKVESFGYTATDMDFLDGRKFSRDEICAVLGVPSILVSQGQDATFANMGTAKAHFWEESIVPLLSDFVATLAQGLLADFGLDPMTWRIVADLTGVPALRENEATRLKNIQSQASSVALLIRAGQYTPESIAETVGLPLVTVQQAVAVDALKSLSAGARTHLEHKHDLVLDDLTPSEALALVRQLKEHA